MSGKASFRIFIFSLIFSCLFASLAESKDTLKQGDTLNSSSSTFLVSAKKIFTLGFFSLYNSNYSYLAIQYTDGHAMHWVWVGNRDTPIANNSGVLTINSAGKLIITHDGREPIELYGSQTGANITATLLDSGNFIVNSSNGSVLWESFDYPTDVLLPGMKLGVNHRTGRNWSLTSWLTQDLPAPGAFTLDWDPSRRRVIVRRRGVDYWSSGALLGDREFEVIKTDSVNFNFKFINVSSKDEEYFSYSLTPIDPQAGPDFQYRNFVSGWWLDYQGIVFNIYGLSIVPSRDCYGYNTDGGCVLWEQPKCRNSYQKVEEQSGGFWDAKNESLRGFSDDNQNLSLSDCRDKCWKDCDCIGFIGGPGCEYWRGPGRFDLDKSGDSAKYFVLTGGAPPPKKRNKQWIWIVIAMAISLVMLVMGSCCYLRKRKRRLEGEEKKRRKEYLQELITSESFNATEVEDGVEGHELKILSFASIMEATNNFSNENKLGEGGFGPVYKGKLQDGREIAVKRLSRTSGQGFVEFKNELILIAKLQHRNLVRVLGCCIHGEEKMLLYEYMPNKSLDFFLFDPAKRVVLDWKKRLNIIEGVAQGLLYLHRYSRMIVIHRDLKASNVLLDENMNPKIADFGMARIFKDNETEAITNRVVGTYGYMSPEYAMEGTFSVKSDVFSFGVLVLEIVSGRRNSSFYNLDRPLTLIGHVWELWKEGTALELEDPTLGESCPVQQLLRTIHVGLLCVQENAADRPIMSDVISMLSNETMPLPAPKRPAFFTGRNVPENRSHEGNSKDCSVNDLSNSIMEAR